MKRIVILLVVLTLSACGTAPLKEEEYPEGGIPPDQWKVLGGATGWFAKT